MYEATVPLTERSERAQAEALQAAMRQVLVRATGRRDAGEDPMLAPLVTDARLYVQQYRVIAGNQFFAGFDGVKLERAITESGQQLWGHHRPATLVVLIEDTSLPILQSEERDSELKRAFTRGATLRGLPIMWPGAARPVDLAEVLDVPADQLRSLATRYGADALLLGRATASPSTGWLVQWTLVPSGEPSEWRGTVEEGAHGAADWFARVFAATPASDDADVAILVGGITDLRAYARVTDYLESLALIRSLAVEQLAGDTVVYRARVQGDAERLARAIELGRRLEPATQPADPLAGAALSFRYRP